MEGFSILNTGSFLIPYVSRNVVGNCYRSRVRIVLLLHVQESGQNLLPFFLMHALADMFGSTFIYLLIAWAY